MTIRLTFDIPTKVESIRLLCRLFCAYPSHWLLADLEHVNKTKVSGALKEAIFLFGKKGYSDLLLDKELKLKSDLEVLLKGVV